MSQTRPEHTPQGDPCARCGIHASHHRKRKRVRTRAAYFARYNANNGHREARKLIIAIDGEGYTSRSGAHRYVYLAACSDQGLVSELREPRGVRASQVLAWLLSLPSSALLVGYSLGYDRTKWLETWEDEPLWKLCRPEVRKSENGAVIFPVQVDGYRVNLVSTRFSVTRVEDLRHATVWDLFKFFQSSFVKALSRWQIGTPAERAFIEAQKKRRGTFRGIGAKERQYCQLECILLAKLARELIETHQAEGLALKSYFGPGSTASLILKECGAKQERVRLAPEMVSPAMCAYFGGRFECAWVGPIKARKLYAYDLASAYPWALSELPCLRHARFEHVFGEAEPGPWDLVHFRVEPGGCKQLAWGPLPHRLPDGNILFPVASAGGWAWGREVRAAQVLHPGVTVLERWAYRRQCTCPPPFKARIVELYERRLQWGKAARGIVLKLGLNSLYGKSAQRVGRSRYRCMVRAGLVTSMTRARLLEAVALAKDPWNVLELATDSILSREPLPIESKGLGGWERKPWPGGVMLMRPGLRFALHQEQDRTAARGVGVSTLHKNRARVLRQWDKHPMAPITLATPSFFHGARLSVRTTRGEFSFDEAQPEYVRDPLYGRWTDETRTLSYSPKPKRLEVGPDFRLLSWQLPLTPDAESCAYGSVTQSATADELDRMRELEEDQPDGAMLALL